MSKTLTYIFLLIFVVCAINFFEFQSFRGTFVKYAQFGYLLVAVIMSLPFIFPKGEGFVLPVQMISFSVLLSMIISWLTWGQSLMDCLAGTILSLIWFIFFYLKHIKFPLDKVERIVVTYGIIYLILYFFQFTHADKNYFYMDIEGLDSSRGIVRIVFPGLGIFYLTSFLAINKLTEEKKNRWLWALLSVLGIVVTVMQVTRQYIFATILIYTYHFIKDRSLFQKIALGGFVIGAIIYITQSDNMIVEGLKDTQDQTVEQGTDYVRVQAAKFFLTDFSHSPINRVLGNGVPYGETSGYYKYTTWYIANYGFWLHDVGLVGLYAMFGVFAVIGYFLIWIKSFAINVPKQYAYLKYYLWFLLLTSLTSATVYLASSLVANVLVIYCYQRIYEDKPAS